MTNKDAFTAKVSLTENEAEALKTVLNETKFTGRFTGITGICPEHGRTYVCELTRTQTEDFIGRIEHYLNEVLKFDKITDKQLEEDKELSDAVLYTAKVGEKLSELVIYERKL